MKRRDFTRIVARGAAGLAVSSPLTAQLGCSPRIEETQGEPLSSIGLQLYTVRDLMQRSVRDTLVEVARIGYMEVEFDSYFGQPVAELRDLLDGLDVTAPGIHLSMEELRDDLDGVMRSAQTMGHEYLIVPWLDPAVRTPSGYRRIADELNTIGERARDAGFMLGYHNQYYEFEAIDGEIGFDIMIENCRPDLVAIEVDLYWMAFAGRDPLEYFSKYPERFRLCHIKDRDAGGNMVDVGKGSLDFATWIAAGRAAGVQHFIVEHDQPADALASVTESFNHLSQLVIS